MQMDKTTRLLPINLQLFADGDGGAGGSNTGSGNAGGTQDPNAGGQQSGGTKVQFTPEQQAAIDAIIAERLSRAEKSAAKKALEARAKELGFDSVDAMEAALKAAKEAQEAQKSETEKLREAKEAAERQAKAAVEQAKQALVRAALMTEAARAGFVDPQDAIRLADTSEIEVKDDGTVTGAKEAVEALVKAKSYLVRTGGSAGAGGGNPARGNVPADDPAERGRQMAAKRNQQAQAAAGFDPWASQGVAGSADVNSIAQAVAAAVAAALKGQGNR